MCGKEWPKEMIRHHIGSHILSINWSHVGKDRPKFPCGFCGVDDAVGMKYSSTSVGACPLFQMSTTTIIRDEGGLGCSVQGDISVHNQAYSMSVLSVRVPGVELQHEGPLPSQASEKNMSRCCCMMFPACHSNLVLSKIDFSICLVGLMI